MLHPQAEALLAVWAAGPSVTDPGFAIDAINRMRREAVAAAAQEHREPVAHVADVDADGVPCRLYLPAVDYRRPLL